MKINHEEYCHDEERPVPSMAHFQWHTRNNIPKCAKATEERTLYQYKDDPEGLAKYLTRKTKKVNLLEEASQQSEAQKAELMAQTLGATCNSCHKHVEPEDLEYHDCEPSHLDFAMDYLKISLMRSGPRRASAMTAVLTDMMRAGELYYSTDPYTKKIVWKPMFTEESQELRDAIDKYYGSMEKFRWEALEKYNQVDWVELHREAQNPDWLIERRKEQSLEATNKDKD